MSRNDKQTDQKDIQTTHTRLKSGNLRYCGPTLFTMGALLRQRCQSFSKGGDCHAAYQALLAQQKKCEAAFGPKH
jgi:hypothetical protein